MKRVVLISLLASVVSCKSKPSEAVADHEQNDSVKIIRDNIERYKQLNNETADSIRKYHLENLTDSLTLFIYLNSFSERIEKWNKTVGEVTLRPTQFRRKQNDTVSIYYTYFVSDSIPVFAEFNSGTAAPIYGFDISINSHKPGYIFVGSSLYSRFTTFDSVYSRMKEDAELVEYQKTHLLSSAFQELLNK